MKAPPVSYWAREFRLRQRLKGSLWFMPLVGGVLGVILAELTIWLQPLVPGWPGWGYTAGAAQGILTAIVTAMVALFGFVVAIGILVMQLATGTLSPRFMRLWYRDRLQKFVLATFVGSIALAFSLLRRASGDQAPALGVTVAGVAVGVSLVLLLLYYDRFAHYLRPVGVGSEVARRGLREAERVTELCRRHHAEPESAPAAEGEPAAVVRLRRSGIIQAINVGKLVAVAERYDCLLVLNGSVGDFVPVGSAVIHIHPSRGTPGPRLLAGLVALGNERTIEDDPGFALRILVDIAIRALSPTLNDPTTAVQLLDHIEVLLFGMASMVETSGRLVLADERRRPRVVMPVRSFADYLRLAVTEIRQYGGRSTQVCRRLTVLLEALRDAVEPARRPLVEAELTKLERTIAANFTDPDDLAYAREGDRQGIGGPASPG